MYILESPRGMTNIALVLRGGPRLLELSSKFRRKLQAAMSARVAIAAAAATSRSSCRASSAKLIPQRGLAGGGGSPLLSLF